jgi:predicted lipoprotein
MLSWQSLEVVQTGPMLENSSLLRDSIYSWPSVSTCVIDQEVLEAENQGSSYNISSRTPLRKGLAALEYILYSNTLDHTCPSNTAKTATWNTRPDTERLAARLYYASAASAALLARAGELKARWITDTNSFRNNLVTAGSNTSSFSSAQAAVNAISDALFYIEKQVKDIKLAEPLGLKGGKCNQGEAGCASFVENPLSARSKEHLRQNLLAFQQVFLGNTTNGAEGSGFDDLIDAVNGGENISAGMEADINSALDAIDALGSMSLQTAVTDVNGVNLAKGIHESTKKITDRLKNDFLNILGLTIPAAAAGDGD